MVGLLTESSEDVGIVRVTPSDEVGDHAGCHSPHDVGIVRAGRPGEGEEEGAWKRVRLNKKNSCTPREEGFHGVSISHSGLEEIENSWFSGLGAC